MSTPVATPRPADRHESAARTYRRRIPLNLVAGQGATVSDDHGRRYIDCLAGAGALALGHGHPVVVEALQRALRDDLPLTTLDLATPTRSDFVDALLEALPPGLDRGRIQFCSPSGADAVEAALKLAKTATGRSGVVAFGGAYHGMTHAALAASGPVQPKLALGALPADVRHLPFPSDYRCPFGVGGRDGAELCTRMLDWALDDAYSGMTPPAAICVEPVQGEGGVNPMPASFAAAVQAGAGRSGALLVVDEVQTGLGRTGNLWASQPLGLAPDVMVLSKAIGGGLPLAVIVYRAELDVWRPGAHAGTFRGNQLAFAAGAATIRHIRAEGLAEQAATMGRRLTDGLREVTAGHPWVGDVRGPGLMVGVELVEPDDGGPDRVPPPSGQAAALVQRAMLERGVIVETGGRGDAVVRFLPPLTIGPHQVDQVVEAFAGALGALGALGGAREGRGATVG